MDRLRHTYVVGVTGSGKTTLLRNLIVQDIEAGRGLAVIDPHGDLVDELLDLIPPRRSDDVVLFDPSDVAYPPAMNLLAGIPPAQRHLAVSGIVGSLKAVWRDSWGPRLEHLLGNAVAALLEAEGQSLLGVSRLFTDVGYRHTIVDQVKDPIARAFWDQELAGYDRRFLVEAAAPIQNKIGQLLLSLPVRNVLGQAKHKIDLRRVMDDGQLLLVRLPRGQLGPDKAALLGSLILGQLELTALSRADTPPHRRQPFHLYVDEFHNFVTDAFASMLSEIRKYDVGMTLAHQYVDQLRPEVREAVFGNVGNLVSFRVGGEDASLLARQFGSDVVPSQLTDLDRHEALVRLLDDGEPTRVTSTRMLPPLGRVWNRGETLRRLSREKFCEPRQRVEEKMNRWLR